MRVSLVKAQSRWRAGSMATKYWQSIASVSRVSPDGPFPAAFISGCMRGASFLKNPVNNLSDVPSGAP